MIDFKLGINFTNLVGTIVLAIGIFVVKDTNVSLIGAGLIAGRVLGKFAK